MVGHGGAIARRPWLYSAPLDHFRASSARVGGKHCTVWLVVSTRVLCFSLLFYVKSHRWHNSIIWTATMLTRNSMWQRDQCFKNQTNIFFYFEFLFENGPIVNCYSEIVCTRTGSTLKYLYELYFLKYLQIWQKNR